MRKIRVLVVDDSTVIRRLLSDTLTEDVEIEIAGTAPNGKIALAKLTQINPDVVTLDMEMPEMDGIETLVELRKTHPKLPVIMFSTLTQRGAEATLDALAKGANDYVTKPANVGSVSSAMNNVRMELIPKIKGFCRWYADEKKAKISSPVARLAPPNDRPTSLAKSRVDIVAIGVSTGGPNALAEVLPAIPANFDVPIVIVQHMPPIFTKHLANRLNQNCALEVVEGEPGQVLERGRVYIAPGDFHMTLKRQGPKVVLEMNQQPPENSCRPAVDVLFRSVAEVYGGNVLATVLTGMGQDGLRGCEVVRDAGGSIIAQDEATSVVWGMPGAVAGQGLASKILPLTKIADEIIFLSKLGRSSVRPEKVAT